MFAIATSENTAFAIADCDSDESEEWVIHYIGFDPTINDSFRVVNLGVVLGATVNPETQAAWVLADHIQAVSRDLRQGFGVPMPAERIVPYGLTLLENRYYLCCGRSTVWAFDRTVNQWIELLSPTAGPDIPQRGPDETAHDYTERTHPIMDKCARDNPDTYAAFAAGGAHYVLGALGLVVRYRGEEMDQLRIEGGPRLIHGFEEDGQLILCADRPAATIYRGSMEGGFDVLFSSDESALHLSAKHAGKRYIGAGDGENCHEGSALFTLEAGELVPVRTGCAREPNNLQQLVSIGPVLWAIDSNGFFRLTKDGWSLTELDGL